METFYPQTSVSVAVGRADRGTAATTGHTRKAVRKAQPPAPFCAGLYALSMEQDEVHFPNTAKHTRVILQPCPSFSASTAFSAHVWKSSSVEDPEQSGAADFGQREEQRGADPAGSSTAPGEEEISPLTFLVWFFFRFTKVAVDF